MDNIKTQRDAIDKIHTDTKQENNNTQIQSQGKRNKIAHENDLKKNENRWLVYIYIYSIWTDTNSRSKEEYHLNHQKNIIHSKCEDIVCGYSICLFGVFFPLHLVSAKIKQTYIHTRGDTHTTKQPHLL